MSAKSARYAVRSASNDTYNVYKPSGAFYMVANGEAHAKRLVASLNKDVEVKRAMRARVV